MGGAPSDDEGDQFADDQVPRSSRINNTAEISRVEDRIGLLVQEHFESFIEKYVPRAASATLENHQLIPLLEQ